ncbi:MAG: hypothetical protein Q9201_002265 [Fulgogasparrea decipioides]
MLSPSLSKVWYSPLNEQTRSRRRRNLVILTFALISVVTALFDVAFHISSLKRISLSSDDQPPAPSEPGPSDSGDDFLSFARGPLIQVPEIPNTFPIVGVVFYGRRNRVEILECYLRVFPRPRQIISPTQPCLQRNLVENGGLLDEVIFVAKTNDVADLEWLDQLIPTSKSYKKRMLADRGINFGQTWDIFEKGTMYIKIDDDVMFIDTSTIWEMVTMKTAQPEYLLVSANGINNPALSWVHYHLGAIHPYLRELSRPEADLPPSWRASELPLWSDGAIFARRKWFDAPYENHRWLPLGPEYTLDGTPITTTTYDKSGSGWNNWAIAAQEHYYFFENLENETLHRYHFDTWDYQYERLSINLIAIWGDNIVDNLPFPDDDEQYLTVDLPKKLGRHSVMNGKALASHYCFNAQRPDGKGLEWTDVLARYKAYAEEKVCQR